MYVRVSSDKVQEAITAIQQVWKVASPEFPFEYAFLDESFAKLYNEENVISKLSLGFTIMAILISGLGLLGLASYSMERRKKEVSIRKVLGAPVANLIVFMSTEFLALTGIALLVGCPLAYYLMTQFLEGYAYHVAIGYSVFIVTACSLLFVTLMVVLVQVTKAAMSNPVSNLRNE